MNIVIWKYRKLLNNKIYHSFFHAVVGLVHGFSTQKNLKIMSIVAVIVSTASFIFHLHYFEIFLVMYSIFCVIITELINTSIELVVDLVTKEMKLKAMLAKDVAASATLIAVLQSICIFIIILLHSNGIL